MTSASGRVSFLILFWLVIVCMSAIVDGVSRGRLFVCLVLDGTPVCVLRPLCWVCVVLLFKPATFGRRYSFIHYFV